MYMGAIGPAPLVPGVRWEVRESDGARARSDSLDARVSLAVESFHNLAPVRSRQLEAQARHRVAVAVDHLDLHPVSCQGHKQRVGRRLDALRILNDEAEVNFVPLGRVGWNGDL